MKLRISSSMYALALWIGVGHASILYNQSNTATTTDPGTGFRFDAVARVSSIQTPTQLNQIHGSAIHLGNGYMLTANHVITNTGNQVTFDGTTFYQVDGGFTPTQVAPNVDLKVFRLNAVPTGVSTAVVYDGVNESTGDAYLVGWGVGRDGTALGSSDVGWGGYTTSDKRWGINQPEDLVSIPYQSGSYTAIRTTLGSPGGSPAGVGDFEAGVTDKDSGSAMFQQIDGQWRIIGVATSVEVAGSSRFGDDVPGSANSYDNYFVRVSQYEDLIYAAVPEVSSLVMTGLLVMLSGCVLYRRRHRL